MENLNAEQIKKALECCVTTSAGDCKNCGYRGKSHDNFITCTNCLIADSLALITSQEQRIGAQDMTISELRQRAEKAEHDADRYAQRIKELTEERDTFRECAYNLQKYVKSFAENQAQGYEPSAAKAAAEMEMWRVIALEKKALTEDNEAKDETITNLLATIADIQAEAVRKMLQRIKEDAVSVSLLSNPPKFMLEIREDALDQIAKEMLEGEVCGNTK
jgi:hypothetical protein